MYQILWGIVPLPFQYKLLHAKDFSTPITNNKLLPKFTVRFYISLLDLFLFDSCYQRVNSAFGTKLIMQALVNIL